MLPLAALLLLGRRSDWLPAVLITLPALALFTLIGPDRAWVASIIGPIPTPAWPLIMLLPIAALTIDHHQKARTTCTTAEK